MNKVGKYEIVKELGHGATSTVYLALDPFNQQQVALKVFNLNALARFHPRQGLSQVAAYRGFARRKTVASAYREDTTP